MCKDDIKINISDSDIYLLRGFRRWWMPPTLLHGNFCTLAGKSGTSAPYNTMKLTSTNDKQFPPPNGTAWNSTETLLFATNDSVCGVFRVDLFSDDDPTYPPRNGTPWNSTETLLYATNDSACGVFLVDLLSNEESKFYEVRVRNARGIYKIAEVCLNYSTATLKQKSFTNCTIYQ
nr:uncharacterized protein LOC129380711 [Dermacentor andersoni]